jgi:hypothetical protein
MAKKPVNKKAKLDLEFSVGDRVEILHFGQGKVIELRGPLGPDGAQVYRVLYSRNTTPAYIEVLASQLRPAKPGKRPKPAGGKLSPVAGAPGGNEAGVGG